jgi:hypothetical protein
LSPGRQLEAGVALLQSSGHLQDDRRVGHAIVGEGEDVGAEAVDLVEKGRVQGTEVLHVGNLRLVAALFEHPLEDLEAQGRDVGEEGL